MNFRSTSLTMLLACMWAACSPGPVPISQSPRDPSNPSAPEGVVPRAGAAAPVSTEAHPAPTEQHAHGATQERPPMQHSATNDAGDASAVYTCSMHPEVASSVPGRCPKCGMNLAPRK